uniref:phospholipid-transporting ATPase VD-like isoform X2 n=1 Tax=Myxine glutinosa TaxID=7769 RepID=UPI00358E95FE
MTSSRRAAPRDGRGRAHEGCQCFGWLFFPTMGAWMRFQRAVRCLFGAGRPHLAKTGAEQHRMIYPRNALFAKESDRHAKHHKDNVVKTTKYSLFTFLPKNIYEQFHRFANLYFLLVVVLNWVPFIEAFNKEITFLPLLGVLLTIAIKDGIEDYRRHCMDKNINHKQVTTYCSAKGRFCEQFWKDLKVGDLVLLRQDEVVPADLLLLASSTQHNVCMLNTSSLDGENNAKLRHAAQASDTADCSTFEPENFSSFVECERPNPDIMTFKGILVQRHQQRIGLDHRNLLLRGCTIVNTESVLGLVIYAGLETKAYLNVSTTKTKQSRLENALNVLVTYCILMLFAMCLFTAIGEGFWVYTYRGAIFDLPDWHGTWLPAPLAGVCTFLIMIIILQVMVPISLYITIEAIKLGHVYFMQQDIDLYDCQQDVRFQCRSLNIPESLGQVQFLFSDKTGTLTENCMEFRCFVVAGHEVSHSTTKQGSHGLPVKLKEPLLAPDPWVLNCVHKAVDQLKLMPNVSLVSREMDILDFFIALAICNSVMVVRSKNHLGRELPIVKRNFSSMKEMEEEENREIEEGNKMLSLGFSDVQGHSSPEVPELNLGSKGQFWDPFHTEEPGHNPGHLNYRNRSSGPTCKEPSVLADATLEDISVNFQIALRRYKASDQYPYQEVDNKGRKSRCNERQCAYASYSNLNGGFEPDEQEMESAGRKDELEAEEGMRYEAQSTDEVALVAAARAYGVVLLDRTVHHLMLSLPGVGPLKFDLLHELAFEVERRMMSVVVRHPLTGQTMVYAKGADSAVMKLLKIPVPDNLRIRTTTQQHLNSYAERGLRTLCIAKKHLEVEDYEKWAKQRRQAEDALEQREELLQSSVASMEANLTLLGATGVEDRLQEGVPQTIDALRHAGLRLWMLTGDKQETALSVAYSCHLLQKHDDVCSIITNSPDACQVLLKNVLWDIDCQDLETTHHTSSHMPLSLSYCCKKRSPNYLEGGDSMICHRGLLLDGETLEMVLNSGLELDFLMLANRCHAVLCCRATPNQKALAVRLVQKKLHAVTLAIGDGANDVCMIQEADVGVGIQGQEGLQAVLSSDFAVSRFKHLQKLILVHGHWSSIRLTNIILYFLYKNAMFVFFLFWYQLFCGFSGSTTLDQWYLILFNLVFTSIPPLVTAVFDRPVTPQALMKFPHLYQCSLMQQESIIVVFWVTMVDAVYQSLACFLLPYFAYADSDVDIFTLGTPLTTLTLITILGHLAIETTTWTWVHCATMVGSLLVYAIFLGIYSSLCLTCSPPSNPYGVNQYLVQDSRNYLVCLITPVVALLPRVVVRALQRTLYPGYKMRSHPSLHVELSDGSNFARLHY